MSSVCKTPSSVAATCKTASGLAATCKTAGGLAGTCKTPTEVGGDAVLSVTPATDYDVFGWNYSFQACLNPDTKVYTLTNTGDSSLDWIATLDDGTYFELSTTSGTLAGGASTTVTVSYIGAGPPPLGVNTFIISFVNTTNGNGDVDHDVVLTIGNTPAIDTMEITRHSQTAELIGWSEFTTPTIPPKKFLTKACSGQVIASYHTPTDCTGPITGWTGQKFSGQTTYDIGTGLPVNGVLEYNPSGGTFAAPAWGAPSTVLDMNFAGKESNGCLACTTTRLQRYALGSAVCDTGFSFPNPQNVAVNDSTLEEILSSEDTEAAAIARATIQADVFTSLAVTAEKQGERGAGEFTRVIQTMDYVFNLIDLLVGAKYLFVLTIQTEPYGGGTQTPSEIEFEFTATATTRQITGTLTPLVDERITLENCEIRCPGLSGGGGPGP